MSDDLDAAEVALDEQAKWGESAQDRVLRWLVKHAKKNRDRDQALRDRIKALEDRVDALEGP